MIEVHDQRQAAANLEALLAHPGWALLVEHLRSKRAEQEAVLVARGTLAVDREAAAGEVRGITAAINEPVRLITRYRGTR